MNIHDPPEAQELRRELIRRVSSRCGAGPRVLDALASVPRHVFVPEAALGDAYRDGPYPIGRGQTISQPTVVAMMTDALQLSPGDRVLEIGTGSGYQTAVLAQLVREVYSVEVIAELSARASEHLQAVGIGNVHLRVDDGYAGWPEQAPFDRVIVTAAPPAIPTALTDQLVDGGILVAPVGARFDQRLIRLRKRGSELDEQHLGAVAFVPMVPGPPA